MAAGGGREEASACRAQVWGLPGRLAAPWHATGPLELRGRWPRGLLLHGLHGLLHVDDELRGLPALRVDGDCLDALHVVRRHHQMVLLGQLHGGLLEGLLDHDRVVGAGLLVRDLQEGEREVTRWALLRVPAGTRGITATAYRAGRLQTRPNASCCQSPDSVFWSVLQLLLILRREIIQIP